MNDMLETMANDQSDDIVDVNATVTDLEGQLETLQQHNDDFVNAIDEANMKISVTTDQVNLTTDQINSDMDPLGLETLVTSQMILADYIEVNEDVIDLNLGTTTVGTFTLCEGETLEFHLALTDEAGTMNADPMSPSEMNELTAVTLLANLVPVAVSNTIAVDDVSDGAVSGYRHTLFYKVTCAGPTTFTIDIDAVIDDMDGTFATVMPGNLQWGYRVYDEGYVLNNTAMDSMCT